MPQHPRTIAWAALDGDSTLREAAQVAAHGLNLALHDINPAVATIVEALVQLQPALLIVVVQPDKDDVYRAITAAKTSPATRKIPILLIDAMAAPDLLRTGADSVITPAAFLTDVRSHIQIHIRADDSAELLRQSRLPLPPLAHTAIEQFNAGEFFEQHETFEALWRAEPGPIRQLYQGLLQVGVAYLQIQRKNYAGARKLFLRATQYLQALPDVCQGIDMAQFRADAQAAQATLEALGPDRIADFPPSTFKPIRFAKID